MTPPTYTDRQGHEHQGRLLSVLEWEALQRIQVALEGAVDDTEKRQLLGDQLALIFPDRAVVDEILGLPAILYEQAVLSFFRAQIPAGAETSKTG